jgi:hypothetical protein
MIKLAGNKFWKCLLAEAGKMRPPASDMKKITSAANRNRIAYQKYFPRVFLPILRI